MSTKDEQNKKTTGREDPTEPDQVGSAKETTTVRWMNQPQSVRRSA